jgi:hypothetical protein
MGGAAFRLILSLDLVNKSRRQTAGGRRREAGGRRQEAGGRRQEQEALINLKVRKADPVPAQAAIPLSRGSAFLTLRFMILDFR